MLVLQNVLYQQPIYLWPKLIVNDISFKITILIIVKRSSLTVAKRNSTLNFSTHRQVIQINKVGDHKILGQRDITFKLVGTDPVPVGHYIFLQRQTHCDVDDRRLT